MKQKEWIVVIVVMIIVAIIVSLITSNLTGNVIKLNQDKRGKYNVYTKAEVDTFNTEIDNTITKIYTMIDGKITNQGVLDMLENECIITNSLLYNNVPSPTGMKVCDEYNSQYQKSTTCILVQQGRSNSVIVPCNINLGTNMTIPNYVMCCSPSYPTTSTNSSSGGGGSCGGSSG